MIQILHMCSFCPFCFKLSNKLSLYLLTNITSFIFTNRRFNTTRLCDWATRVYCLSKKSTNRSRRRCCCLSSAAYFLSFPVSSWAHAGRVVLVVVSLSLSHSSMTLSYLTFWLSLFDSLLLFLSLRAYVLVCVFVPVSCVPYVIHQFQPGAVAASSSLFFG